MPGQKIDRNSNSEFVRKVKTERIRLQDSGKLNNYCAVQVNFGDDNTQDAIAFSVRPPSSEKFSVGNHSEVRAIAKCIHKEIIKDSTLVNKNGINLDILATGAGDALAKQVEIFFSNNLLCSVIGYSDRQPCKAPTFAANTQYQGCEQFLQSILPGDRHKIDYSFEYSQIQAEKQDGTPIPNCFQYKYNEQEIQRIFQQELPAAIPKPLPKPRITYFKQKPAAPIPEIGSSADTSGHLERFEQENPRVWDASNAELARRETQTATVPALQDQPQISSGKGSAEHSDSDNGEPPSSKPKPAPKPKS